MHIVTRDTLVQMLNDENKRVHVIGRALTAIFRRQTEDEKRANTTKVHNKIGFSGPDARTGSLSAKYYIGHNTLQDWQVRIWMKEVHGFPRICKYWKQLDQIARERAAVAHHPKDQ